LYSTGAANGECSCTWLSLGFPPSSYLGPSLGAKFKEKFIWESCFERFERRLSGWKTKYLSKGGRQALTYCFFWSIPTYFLLLFSIPSSVVNKLEAFQMKFLLGTFGDDFKYHFIK